MLLLSTSLFSLGHIGTFLVYYYRSHRDYQQKLNAGCWMEGIFVFPTTGDVVVRLHGTCRNKEITFHRERLQRAAVEEKFVLGSCRWTTEVLAFEGVSPTGEPERCQVSAHELVHPPREVLDYLVSHLKLHRVAFMDV